MWNNGASFIRPIDIWRQVGLAANQRVIHLGCGPGFYLLPAAELVGAKGSVIGIDIRPDILREAESRARRAGLDHIIDTLRLDLEQGPSSSLPPDEADYVLVANILHQAESQSILAEAARLVKPDGKVVVIEWDVGASPLGPPPEQRIRQEKVIEISQTVGLVHEKSFRPSPYHYGLVFTGIAST